MAYPAVNWTIMVYISADNVLANFAIESLKQLRDAAGNGIVVVAEFDDNQQEDARMYLFDGDSKKRTLPIENSRIPKKEVSHLKTIRHVDMTRPETLTEFIDYASDLSKTERYCLIVWGHGIELLLDQERRFGTTNRSARRHLTSVNLKKAIQDTKLAKGRLGPNHPKTILDDLRSEQEKGHTLEIIGTKRRMSRSDDFGRKQKNRHTLDIMGLDACSMSMIEVASELQDCVDFMIASQEDVPDASFPYEKILSDLRAHNVRDDVRKVCKMIPRLYDEAFRDYIANADTGVKGITLASLDLRKVYTIAGPLSRLSTALLASSFDKSSRKQVLSARKNTQDFVFGLLVDVCDFCHCLDAAFTKAKIKDSSLHSACEEICKALKVHDDGFVIANQSRKEDHRCHGLSIYLPYRYNKDETDNAEEQFAKGGTRKPLKVGTREPLKERTARIRELEADFARLDEFRRTRWIEFIKRGWSFILANKTPFKLDYYYSAEQVAQNLRSFTQKPPLAAKVLKPALWRRKAFGMPPDYKQRRAG